MMIHLLSKGTLCQEGSGCDPNTFMTALEFAEGGGTIPLDWSDRNMYPTVPRIIMTHMPASHLSVQESEGRYLIIIRDPVKQMLSKRTMEFFLIGPILRLPLDEFITLYTETRETGWADHVHQWWRLRNLPNVCVIFYEDIVQAPEATVRTVAKFAKVKLNRELIDIVTRRMTKEWALEHVDRTHHAAVTPLSPPISVREESGSLSSFIVDHSKFFSIGASETFTPTQEAKIRSAAKAKLLALDAVDGVSDGAHFIKKCPGYFP